MTPAQNIEVVRRWFAEVWNQRNLDTIDELLAKDAIAYDMGGPGASTQGPTAFRAVAEHLHRAFGEMHLEIEDIFAVDDRVAVRLTGKLKQTGPLGDLPPTNREIRVPIMCLLRMRDGQITEGWNHWDVATALRAANAPVTQTTLF